MGGTTIVTGGLLICGAIAAVIGSAKNRSVLGSFLLGAFLGLIGVLIVAVVPKLPPEPPPGMRAVQCPRCNAVQNLPLGLSNFECWQCKLVSNVAGAEYVAGGGLIGRRAPDEQEDLREWLNRVKKRQER
ncbi:hypothetical protein [Mycobacterium noviomagense]|uniref:Uncharacterized protein n=1 Tax=Mycobacterium noviomagense TaxID=459858 RepID=A0A7I7PI01_9MYCO|nr:hypothetical protein [Mycobacterium noviomagense]ORB16825.1 hypothetical protein BST37_05920 [Mycobacterium noviomagense]BBY08175.1 hypothetical protein MNVI_34930 [Mycobacterium noviomagense]